MSRKIIVMALLAAMIATGLALPAPRPTRAQNDRVTVTFVLEEIIAQDLQEDATFWADHVDEIVLMYIMQELRADGSLVSENIVSHAWEGTFELGQRRTTRSFPPLSLEIAADSGVRIDIQMRETEREVGTLLNMAARTCRNFVPAMVGTAANTANPYMLGAAVGGTVACVLGNVFPQGDTELTGTGSQRSFTSAQLEDGVENSFSLEWHINLGIFINDTVYDVRYSLNTTRENAPPATPSRSDSGSRSNNEDELLVTLPGSFGSEIGCEEQSAEGLGGDWEPLCTQTQMRDPDGNGIYTFETDDIPAGTWEVKVTVGGSWDENYGRNGVSGANGGENIVFTVPENNMQVAFTWNSATKRLQIYTSGGSAPGN